MEISVKDFEIFRQMQYSEFDNNGKSYLLSSSPYLDIVLHDHCNAKCKFCIGHLVHSKQRLDIEKSKEKIQYAINKMGVKEVLLLGGEPTTSKDFFTVVKYLKENYNLDKICTTTNGFRMAQDSVYAHKVFSSGITHLNLSLMSLDRQQQKYITGKDIYIGVKTLAIFKGLADQYNVKLRINNNVFKGNHDNTYDAINFYESVKSHCHSVKFSPLLKTDSFSTVNEVTDFNNTHLLSDERYDTLWGKIENYYRIALIRNKETFGFVEYSMICNNTPIILNYNQHGKLREKIINEKKINNIKLLTTGELSLSWNREESDYFITTQ